jgi:hypothetical protein
MLGKLKHQPPQSTRTVIPPPYKNHHQRFDQLNSHEYFPNEVNFYPTDPGKKYSSFHQHSYPPNLYRHFYPTTKIIVQKRRHKKDEEEEEQAAEKHELSLLDKLNPFKCEEDESEDYDDEEP